MQTAEGPLTDYVISQRWFGSKSQDVAEVRVLESVPLDEGFQIAIVEVAFHPGTHELYQVPMRSGDIADALADPEFARAVARRMDDGADVETEHGVVEFRRAGEPIGEVRDVRPMGAEQSNSSLVLDDRIALKAYRRLGAGPNPELEVLRFLTERRFEHIAALRGWYGHTGRLIDATLGIAQEFVPGSVDGWDLALQDLRIDPQGFVEKARELGDVTGKLHTALASDASDPAFAPEETSAESLGLLTATVDEEIEQVFLDLPDNLDELAPIRGRGQEVRERLSLLTTVGSAGRIIRHHGDYHLGQVLRGADGRWVVLDFEGEPARSLVERRRKRSPLRDVAGMLRSFAYAASASRILHDVHPPEGWEESVRAAFLEGYLATVDTRLLPPGTAAIERLIAVFELEKAVYELRYELDNRPDWASIPVAGIARLLELEEEQAT
ncbi:MAG: maltokinase [Solirubrobacteraceae bacterium]|nr:maltokinase [Solirubrobacteraceae bacterium]